MKLLRKVMLSFILMVFILAIPATAACAQEQEEELSLSLKKSFGYNIGADIEGAFTLKADAPVEVIRVVFYIDGEILAEDTEAPFSTPFNTNNFPPGRHTMTAVGYTSSGKELRSREIGANFLTPEESQQGLVRILIPLLGLTILVVLLAGLFPLLVGKKKKESLPLGAERNYGIRGGGICPKCSRPFALHTYGLNFITHKFDRCPYCGKWSFVRRLPLQKLREAEKAELEMASAEEKTRPASEEEKLLKTLEDSRYTDL